MTTWNATTIAAGDYSALPTLPGVLVGFSYNESEAGRSAPAGTAWVPIQRDDEAATYESDEDAADAYARAVGSPEESTRGYALDGNADVFAADMFVAVPIGATIDARGVVELPASSPLATICGTCGRGWRDEVSTAWTPTPGGRCPFEYDHHPDEHDPGDYADKVAELLDTLNGEDSSPHYVRTFTVASYGEPVLVAEWDGSAFQYETIRDDIPADTRRAFDALTELVRGGGALREAIDALDAGDYGATANPLYAVLRLAAAKREDMARDLPGLLAPIR